MSIFWKKKQKHFKWNSLFDLNPIVVSCLKANKDALSAKSRKAMLFNISFVKQHPQYNRTMAPAKKGKGARRSSRVAGKRYESLSENYLDLLSELVSSYL